MRGLFGRLEEGWNRFWFEPQDTSTLALFRIAFGLLATFWTLSLVPDVLSFFGPDGILPAYPRGVPGAWGVLAVSNTKVFVVAVFVATLLGSLALTVGLHTRIAAVVVYLGIQAFLRRNPLVGNSGDELIGNLTLFCALAPSGAALSVDRLRAAPGRFWEFPARAPWALRLIQIQLSVVYLSAVWGKMQGEQWRNGTAVSTALRITDVHRFPTPEFLTHSMVVSEFLTFGTLGLEIALGTLIWNHRMRPWVVGLGILMHIAIDLSILVGFFSFAMIVCYLAFIPARTAGLRIVSARDWCIGKWPKARRPAHRARPVAARVRHVAVGAGDHGAEDVFDPGTASRTPHPMWHPDLPATRDRPHA